MTAGRKRFAEQAGEGAEQAGLPITVEVDGVIVKVAEGSSLLEACDAAGAYVPRLCYHPGLGRLDGETEVEVACGLCQVRTADGSTGLACRLPVTVGERVTTDDAALRSLRREKLAAILDWHPHVCLSCPDRDGCARDECVHGNPPEARCCDELGLCELGKVVAFVDPEVAVRRRAVAARRAASTEGRIRREPGLCVGCGRCVLICARLTSTGGVLEMAGERRVARPKRDTLRDSGCTFCGLCVLVCPTGAMTAPGPAGARWLAACRERQDLPAGVFPPEEERFAIPEDVERVPSVAGVLTLFDASGKVLRITGAADIRVALTRVLRDSSPAGAKEFRFEVEPLYTQRETELLAQYTREHGRLPAGDDLGDELFDDEPG